MLSSTQPIPAKLPPIVFLGGKGGVGKTTLAAALAVGFAERGERTLLVSTDPAHSLSDLLDIALDDSNRQITKNLYARELDPDRARDRYLAGVIDNIREFSAPEFLDEATRQVRLAGQHPGVADSALFEALCRVLDDADGWDRVVVDTAPTGHTLHLFTLPESMRAWSESLLAGQVGAETGQGPRERERWKKAADVLAERRTLFERIRDRLGDARQTGFLLTVNDDRLSVLEAQRARETLQRAGVAIPAVVINRLVSDPGETRARLGEAFPGLDLFAVPSRDPLPQGLAGLRGLAGYLQASGLAA
jgi:arsenite-transporting ATPase